MPCPALTYCMPCFLERLLRDVRCIPVTLHSCCAMLGTDLRHALLRYNLTMPCAGQIYAQYGPMECPSTLTMPRAVLTYGTLLPGLRARM